MTHQKAQKESALSLLFFVSFFGMLEYVQNGNVSAPAAIFLTRLPYF